MNLQVGLLSGIYSQGSSLLEVHLVLPMSIAVEVGWLISGKRVTLNPKPLNP